MSAHTTTRPAPNRRRSLLINVGLVVLLVAIFAVSLAIGAANTDEDDPFAGTDATVTEMVEEQGHEPWFSPIFEPAGELESGLFALQAGLGGLVFGYAIGRLHGRRLHDRAGDDHPDPQTGGDHRRPQADTAEPSLDQPDRSDDTTGQRRPHP